MKAIAILLQRISNWKTLLLFLVLYISFPAYFFKNAEAKINSIAGHEIGPIDLTFGFNPAKTLIMIQDYGAASDYYAKTELTTDAVYPIVYAFLFGIILTMLYRGKKVIWVAVLPFIDMLFDYAENISIVYLLKTFPEQSFFVATLCEIFKMLKWLTLGVILVMIIYGLVIKMIKRDTLAKG